MRGRGVIRAGLVAVAAMAAAMPSAPTEAKLPPVVVWSGTSGATDRVHTADTAGHVFHRFRDEAGYLSRYATQSGGRVAITRHHSANGFASDVLIHDAATGERLHEIVDARFALLLWNGTGALFLPDNWGVDEPGDRDKFSNSVWFRDLEDGSEHRLARFKNGDFGMPHLAGSPRGDRVAFTRGDDTFRFRWNIWVGRPRGEAQKITDDGQAEYPSFRPDGRRLAFQVQHGSEPCTGGLATMRLDGSRVQHFYDSTCERSLTRPIWIDDTHVVAWWWEHDPVDGARPRGLVPVDVETGVVGDPLVRGPVLGFSVSRELGLVAFRLRSGRIGLHDLATDARSWVPGGRRAPGTEIQLEGSYELG